MKTKARAHGRTTKRAKEPGKLAATTLAAPSLSENGQVASSVDVLTLAETAAFLRVAEEEVKKFVDAGKLPGKNIGGEWRILKSALCDWLSKPEPITQPLDWRESNRRMLELAGAWKDDETLPALIEHIYKERRQNLVGEG